MVAGWMVTHESSRWECIGDGWQPMERGDGAIGNGHGTDGWLRWAHGRGTGAHGNDHHGQEWMDAVVDVGSHVLDTAGGCLAVDVCRWMGACDRRWRHAPIFTRVRVPLPTLCADRPLGIVRRSLLDIVHRSPVPASCTDHLPQRCAHIVHRPHQVSSRCPAGVQQSTE